GLRGSTAARGGRERPGAPRPPGGPARPPGLVHRAQAGHTAGRRPGPGHPATGGKRGARRGSVRRSRAAGRRAGGGADSRHRRAGACGRPPRRDRPGRPRAARRRWTRRGRAAAPRRRNAAAARRPCDPGGRPATALATGVSTVRAGLPEVADAYAEARIARDGLGAEAGVLALPLLSSLDYLVLRDDETARRLIRPEVRRFVEEDAAAGGALIAT